MPSYLVADDAVIVRTDAATAGWTDFTTLQTVFDAARVLGRPLFFREGTYDADSVTVLASNGNGKPLLVRALPGSAILRYTGQNTFLKIEGQNHVEFEGLIFNGENRTVGDYVYERPAFIAIADGTYHVRFHNCRIVNSSGIGIYVTRNANARFETCVIENHSVGVWSENAVVQVLGCTVSNMANNGIAIWRDSVTGDSSTLSGNTVNGIESAAGGTGQHGNGISVFRAVGVTVTENKIFNVKYSAIRCNGGGSFNISNNNIFNTREVAIFIEAPGVDINLTGAIVSNNSLESVGNGILVTNSGQAEDGISRSVVVEGNRISNVTDNPIPDPGYYPPSTIGNGIVVEQDCVVSGNLIEGSAGIGIQAGTNTAVRGLVVTGNLVRNAPVGIGVSHVAVSESDRSVVISGNIVNGASLRGIAPMVFVGDATNPVGTVDYGNELAISVGSVTFGHNRYL